MKMGNRNVITRVQSRNVLMVCAAVFLLTVWGSSSPALAVDVCGGIFVDTTWTVAESPYIVTCDVTLFPGYTLAIEAGVSVQFHSGTSLIIRGTLNAIGTATNRITFTSANPPNNWGGVQLATNLGGNAVIEFADFSYASTAVSVECCYGVAEPANISSATFSNNQTALGGYAGNNVIVKASTFENNNSAITQADKLIYDSVFKNNTYGLSATERISVYNSTFEGNQVALYGGRGTVQNCTISGNGTGVQGFFEGFTLSKNTITNNDVGVILTQYDSFSPPVEYNNIFGNTMYNVEVTGPANKSAPNNWWGTTNTGEIDAKIYDGQDNPTLGLLEYMPFLTGPVPAVATDLSLTKTDSPDPVLVGDALTYTIVVTNNGPDDATGVTLTDTLPSGVTLVSATPTQGSCSGTNTITCGLGTLANGASATVTIVVTSMAPGMITNTASISGTEPDPNPVNNTAMEGTTIESSGVGGSVIGVDPTRVVCKNLTTRQTVIIQDDAKSWDCEAAGLVVTPGDIIQQTVTGPAD